MVSRRAAAASRRASTSARVGPYLRFSDSNRLTRSSSAAACGGIDVECLGVVGEVAFEVLEFEHGGFERGGVFADRGIEFFEFADESLDLGEAVEDAVLAIERGGGGGGGFHQAAGVRGAAPAVFEFLLVLGFEVGGVDFLELIAEQFEFLFAGVFGVAEFFEFGGLGAPCAVVLAVGGMGGVGAGVGVEHGELALGGEQRLVVVRAMQVHQVFAEALEQGQRDRRIIDKLAVGGLADHAADDELGVVAGFQPAVCQDGVDLARVAEFEHGLDRAGLLAGADQRFVGAFAEDEFEGADDDRTCRHRFRR